MIRLQKSASSISKSGMKTDSLLFSFRKYTMLYLLAIPGVIYFIIIKYIPLFGAVIAFKDYNIFAGVWKSKWVGLKHFKEFFTAPDAYHSLLNTIILGGYELLFFPLSMIVALMLNELRFYVMKRVIQTVIYVPHFLSWVIIGGIFVGILSPSTGIVNKAIELLGFEPIYFMGSESYIRSILISAGIWQGVGWGTIIYLAALAGVNTELYEAAAIDGASRWKQMWAITIPSLMPTFVVLLLLHIGNFLDIGFERVYPFVNPLNMNNGDILDTYIYRIGLLGSQYSLTTAIGLFKSVVGVILIMTTNYMTKKLTDNSLF
jgi:putative aldouronate transport system permease protein